MKRMKQEKEMEREAALKYLAEGIWTMGEIRNGHGCIVPSTKLSFRVKRDKLERLVGRSVTQGERR